MYFKVGETDFSSKVEPKKYDVESTKEYEEWKDGNFKKHRVYVRDRIKGKIRLWFLSEGGTDYTSFLNLLKENTVDGTLLATVRVNNTNEEKEARFYYSIKSVTNMKMDLGATLNHIEMEIEEC